MVNGNDKSFQQRYADDAKNAKSTAPTSNFAKLYRSKRPSRAEDGGWDGIFQSDLTMHTVVGIDPTSEDNDCMTRCDGGLFVWSDRTMTKLNESSISGTLQSKQLKYVCYMFELMYNLMMDRDDAIIDAAPFGQFLGPIQRPAQ